MIWYREGLLGALALQGQEFVVGSFTLMQPYQTGKRTRISEGCKSQQIWTNKLEAGRFLDGSHFTLLPP
jgi:hypothetical protein